MSFVVSSGQLAVLGYAPTLPSYHLRLANDFAADYAEIYRTQPAVRTVVDFLGRNIAQLGLHVFQRVDDTDRRRLSDHPLAVLLRRPNPYTTRYRLMRDLVQDKAIYDAAYWLKLKTPNGFGVVRLPPPQVELLGESGFAPEGYRLHSSKGIRDFAPEQIVHFRGYSPDNNLAGVPPMETLRQTLAEAYAASQMREQVMRNGARMSGYLTRPAGNRWDAAAKQRFRADWQAQYTGNGPSAGGTPILEDGMEFKAASQTAEQLQYIEARKLAREETAATFHIPPPMVGILDHATFGNIKEQHKMLYQDTLGPPTTEIVEDIELQLLPDLDPDPTVYVEFNLAEKMRGSFEEQAAAASTATGRPWMTVNEQRGRMNLPRIDDGDELVVPLNVLVGGLASPRDTAPEPTKTLRATSIRLRPHSKTRAVADHGEYVDLFRQTFRRQAAAVRSQLGAAKARHTKASLADVWDAARWDRELATDLLLLAIKTTTAVAKAVLSRLGLPTSSYDVDRTEAFLTAISTRVARSVNATTAARIADALDSDDPESEIDDLFDYSETARAEQAATTQVTDLSGFATVEAVKQTGNDATKTWIVTSNNPRATHLAMNGQTVGLEDEFSNGAPWPAAAELDLDERAGCQCELDITIN